MRLDKLPFEVVLLVGRVNFHRLYMVKVSGGGVGFGGRIAILDTK